MEFSYFVLYGLIIFLSLLFIGFWARKENPFLAAIPGPQPLPFVGNTLMMVGPTELVWLSTMKHLKKTYGNVVKFYVGTKVQIVLLGATGFEKILSSSRNITKGFQYEFAWPWLGQGLLTSTGAKWHQHRKLLTPAFHFRILEDFLHIMNDHTHTLLDKVGEHVGQAVDVYPLMTHCALDIICETTMGVSVNAQNDSNSEYVKAVYETSELVFKRLISPWLYSDWIYNRTASGKQWNKNLEVLHGFTKKIIKERRALKTVTEDHDIDQDEIGIKKRMAFLDILIKTSEDGTVLSDKEVQEEVDTFMFEGHDTTASNTAMTLYLLALDMESQRKCQEELENIFGDSERAATSADLANMKYLTACIKESLRLYGSVPSIGRVTSEEVEIEGKVIPAGTEVALQIMVLHRDPEYFPDPEKFDPNRFLDSEVQVNRHPYAYTPFSAGPRNCIGQKFAMMEEKIILSSILRRFNLLAEVEMKDMLLAPELVLKPRNGLFVKFEQR